ncbi:PucR family transcriptional regulator [Peribacillus kribbensis]|uniref:PucR family transcriptional regulator n=1 Tax=Peribacillus kribbensis TaxID=356658 RepID=UPI00041DD77E|nr:PucR family transcriptional regulator [Peribacillus kribbensis]
MKVYELLTIRNLNGMHLIAGMMGKERDVKSVNMMDAPDIIHYLKEDEFLVTTAYHLKDDPHSLLDLIREMHIQGCSALGIKTKRFIDQIPEEVIELANELSFPVIELPLHLSLGDIVNQTFRAILDRRAAELSFALETHKQFTNIVMQGKGLPLLLRDLSRMIQRPVQIVDQYFRSMYRSGPAQDFPCLKDRMSKFPFGKRPVSLSFLTDRQTYTFFPVYISERKTGFLMIAGEVLKSDPFTLLTIEQAANVISFSLIKEHALQQHGRSMRNDFFLQFLEGSFSSQEEIAGRAKEFSLANDRGYLCAVGKLDEYDLHTSYSELPGKMEDIYGFIEEETAGADSNLHFFMRSGCCILLFEAGEYVTDPFDKVKSKLVQLQTKVSQYFAATISFGLSNWCDTFLQVRNAYKEAEDALCQGKLVKKKEYIHTYHSKDIMGLMRRLTREDLENYYSCALRGFADPAGQEEQSLLETLFVYVETHCQISETAKKLFVHRNTVVYRIEKCEEILGRSLRDPETTIQIRMAFRVKSLLEKV